jgi:hypothetical protein
VLEGIGIHALLLLAGNRSGSLCCQCGVLRWGIYRCFQRFTDIYGSRFATRTTVCYTAKSSLLKISCQRARRVGSWRAVFIAAALMNIVAQ